jgi:hypothetical protein
MGDNTTSRAGEGAESWVMPAGGKGGMGLLRPARGITHLGWRLCQQKGRKLDGVMLSAGCDGGRGGFSCCLDRGLGWSYVAGGRDTGILVAVSKGAGL